MMQWELTGSYLGLEAPVFLSPSEYLGPRVQRAGDAVGGADILSVSGDTTILTNIWNTWGTYGQSTSVSVRGENTLHFQKDTASLTFCENTRDPPIPHTPFDFGRASSTEKIPVLGSTFVPASGESKCVSDSTANSCLASRPPSSPAQGFTGDGRLGLQAIHFSLLQDPGSQQLRKVFCRNVTTIPCEWTWICWSEARDLWAMSNKPKLSLSS